ncbi:hypothetical protein GQ53DRAFT_748684 [Thozetella sp. PMI_491]|nr:hypothetical protein GQ53DRAFT_748684 [Thozetella sp. PMI_491]
MRLVSTLPRRIRRQSELASRANDYLRSPQRYPYARSLWLPDRSRTKFVTVRHSVTASGAALVPRGAPADAHLQPASQADDAADKPKPENDAFNFLLNNQPRSLPVTPNTTRNPGDYGKWQWLSLRPDLLDFESDVESTKSEGLRLVDQPENENDIQLWSCILNFRHRRNGSDGVAAVLEGLQRRRCLHAVHGESALLFWQTILYEALPREERLWKVRDYAEWLHATHRVHWPSLYATTISYFLQRKQRENAVRWHLLLAPHFGPSAGEFASLLRKFITQGSEEIQDGLKCLYSMSLHRCLYDELVPFVYAHGHYSNACKWRNHLLLHDDQPRSAAARPFLRFVAGYLPKATPLVPRELQAAGLRQKTSANGIEYERHDEDFWYVLNRVHGETFGIKEKRYSDTVGARWFASSWAPLDLALDVVRMLGFNAIGPLSLQSIAIREGSADLLHVRIQHLRKQGINLGNSTYARAVRHFAAAGDQESLDDLLSSDIHPDVFDDLETLDGILKTAVADKDWKKYYLILAVKAVCLSSDHHHPEQTVALTSNHLLGRSFVRGDKSMMLKLLEDMSTRGIQVSPSISDAISTDILEKVSPHVESDGIDLHFYSTLCKYIINTRFPLASQAFQVVLLRLCREGSIDDMERLSLAVARRYDRAGSHEGSWWFAHDRDVPDVVQEERSGFSHFQMVPRTLYEAHPLHPLRLIFSAKLQRSIIRASFRSALSHHQKEHGFSFNLKQPKDYGFARGVRLLALLKERGVHVTPNLVSKAITSRLAEIYGAGEETRKRRALRAKNQLSLEQARDLCNAAWGSELLPPLPEFVRLCEKRAIESDRIGSR